MEPISRKLKHTKTKTFSEKAIELWDDLSSPAKVLSVAFFFLFSLSLIHNFTSSTHDYQLHHHDLSRIGQTKHAAHHHINAKNLPKRSEHVKNLWPNGRNKKELKNCDLFAVITTIFEVNAAVKNYLSVVKNTCLIVIGDKKTNHQEWEDFCLDKAHVDACLYLNPDEQLRLPYKLVEKVPFNHFGRKSIGFLVAMDYGAEVIYDFDDDNHLNLEVLSQLKDWKRSEVTPKQVTTHMYNPYVYFEPKLVENDKSDVMVWPRGFPLDRILDENNYKTANLNYKPHADYNKIAVIQSLANHDPDVDAIYRMTGKLPIEFTRKKEIVVLGENIQCPWNAQGTLIKKAAFWSMLLPITVEGRVSDIWRSYIGNKLMVGTGYQVAFTSPFVAQFRNPHSYSEDFHQELDLYNNGNKLLSLLAGTSIKTSETLDQAYLRVYKDIVKEDLLGEEDLALSVAWIADLKSLGYEFPKIVSVAKAFEMKEPKIVDQRDAGPGVVTGLKKIYEFRVRRSLGHGMSRSFLEDVDDVMQKNNLV